MTSACEPQAAMSEHALRQNLSTASIGLEGCGRLPEDITSAFDVSVIHLRASGAVMPQSAYLSNQHRQLLQPLWA